MAMDNDSDIANMIRALMGGQRAKAKMRKKPPSAALSTESGRRPQRKTNVPVPMPKRRGEKPMDAAQRGVMKDAKKAAAKRQRVVPRKKGGVQKPKMKGY
jgi:hypothetical protein